MSFRRVRRDIEQLHGAAQTVHRERLALARGETKIGGGDFGMGRGLPGAFQHAARPAAISRRRFKA